MIAGFGGNQLRIDLTTGAIARAPLAPAFARAWLGGRGFVAKILYDEVPRGADPLGPENRLVVTPGVMKETGQVKILKYIAAHGVGRAINPMLLEGQVYGGVMMGVGYALSEQVILEKGETMNPNFRDYKILTARDAVPIEAPILETHDKDGPYGAKGIGEPGCVPTAPAIANAIYNAVGVRIKDLPITPERVLAAIREKKGLDLCGRDKDAPGPEACVIEE